MALKFVHIVGLGITFALILLHVCRASTRKCETVNLTRPPLLGGADTVKGEWPFVVAIQSRSGSVFCGGTIIANKHILTAAHCIQQNSDKSLSTDEVVVRLGAYNLTDTNEKGVILRNVSAIFMHPEYDAFASNCDADIAILVLSENITFTDYIQPVHLPADIVTEDMQGTVVGYSHRKKTGQIHAETPRRITVNAVSWAECYRQDASTASYTSNRTFCGGHGDGSPDLGDSGSGFFCAPGISWAQYGIVSLVRSNATGHIHPQSYHVYTNVTNFKDWIIETVNGTGGVVGEVRVNISMNCDYEYTRSDYSCKLNNVDIQGDNFETGWLVGSHLNRKGPTNVKEIHFVSGTMSYLPSGFGLFFKNIMQLTVGTFHIPPDSPSLMGTKSVRQRDLRYLRNLRRLIFYRNDIHTLHADAFWDLPNLQSIKFVDNKLQNLSEETFSKNKRLWRVDFQSNQINFLHRDLFRNNAKLKKVDFRNNFIQTVDAKIFKTNRKLRKIFFGLNKLEKLPERLLRNNILVEVVSFKVNLLKEIYEKFFETNKGLQSADFSSNELETLPKHLFRNNFPLRKVNFENNLLSSIDKDLFESNLLLNTVKFGFNRIEWLPQNLFRGNPGLEVVEFQNNFLKEIDENFFINNNMLLAFDISSNRLETVPKELYLIPIGHNYIPKFDLNNLHFDNNPFNTIEGDAETFPNRYSRQQSEKDYFLQRNRTALAEKWKKRMRDSNQIIYNQVRKELLDSIPTFPRYEKNYFPKLARTELADEIKRTKDTSQFSSESKTNDAMSKHFDKISADLLNELKN